MKIRDSKVSMFLVLGASLTVALSLGVFLFTKDWEILLLVFGIFCVLYFFPALFFYLFFYIKITEKSIIRRMCFAKNEIKKEDLLGLYFVKVRTSQKFANKTVNETFTGRYVFIRKNKWYLDDDPKNEKLIEWLYYNDFDYVTKFDADISSGFREELIKNGYSIIELEKVLDYREVYTKQHMF